MTACDGTGCKDDRVSFLAGKPYHWHDVGGWLALRRGYPAGHPSHAEMLAREQYRAWVSSR